jgi:hypothetical protein
MSNKETTAPTLMKTRIWASEMGGGFPGDLEKKNTNTNLR